jgi:hypothetical protein
MIWHNLGFSDNGWEDMRFPLLSTRIPAVAGPDFVQFRDNGAGSTGVYQYAFDPNTDESVYFNVQMPHSWIQGTTIDTHIHWSTIAPSTGTAGQKVSWGMEYTMVDVVGEFPTTTIVYGDTPVLWTEGDLVVPYKHYLTDLGDIDMSSIERCSAMFSCRFFRDSSGAGGTDDYAQDAMALEVDFHYKINRLGSPFEYGDTETL